MADDTKTTSSKDAGLGTPVQTQPPPKKKSDNPYEYTQQEQADLTGYDLDHPISRAWSRMNRHGYVLGRPTEPVKEENGVARQSFQFSAALMNLEDNANMEVCFYDARGLIDRENGL